MQATAVGKISNVRAIGAALWIAQGLLALAFLPAGAMKLLAPTALPFAGAVPSWLVTAIGIAEIVGAIGVMFPALLRLRPGLTPLAALGLAGVMLCAAVFHLARGELTALPPVVTLGALALFVFWGRTRKLIVTSRREP